jgi:hypothetical protein
MCHLTISCDTYVQLRHKQRNVHTHFPRFGLARAHYNPFLCSKMGMQLFMPTVLSVVVLLLGIKRCSIYGSDNPLVSAFAYYTVLLQ